MRLVKTLFIISLSAMVFLTTACQKDSVGKEKKEPPAETTAVHTTPDKEKPKPKQSDATVKKDTPSKTADKTKKEPNETKTTVTENKATKEKSAKSAESTTKSASKTPPPIKKAVQDTVSIQVVGYKGATVLSLKNAPIKKGDTALSVTQGILKSKGISISVRGSGATAYVEGINNVFEMDHGPMSGWIAYINGKKIDRSAGTISIKQGDKILWKYSMDGK